MSLPINARVEAAPNFVANLAAAHAFFASQDEESADLRLSKLKAELREMTAVADFRKTNPVMRRTVLRQIAEGFRWLQHGIGETHPMLGRWSAIVLYDGPVLTIESLD